jgi:flagellar basal-body rod protein FlgC
MNAISISQSGLMAAANSLAVSAANVANQRTVGKLPDSSTQNQSSAGQSTVYQPVDSVDISLGATGGVQTTYQPRQPSYSAAYQPDSPDANTAGMVAAPKVDPVQENLTQTRALQAYQSNATVLGSSEQMQNTLLSTLA